MQRDIERELHEMGEEGLNELTEQYFKERDGYAFNNDGSFTDGFKEFVYKEELK